MKANHTPGQWEIRDRLTIWDGFNNTPLAQVHPTLYRSGDQSALDNGAIAEANARLIAAAPQMLEALHRVCRDLEYAHGGHNQMPELEAGYYDQAKRAWLKATGQPK